jgi:hypothetical protein
MLPPAWCQLRAVVGRRRRISLSRWTRGPGGAGVFRCSLNLVFARDSRSFLLDCTPCWPNGTAAACITHPSSPFPRSPLPARALLLARNSPCVQRGDGNPQLDHTEPAGIGRLHRVEPTCRIQGKGFQEQTPTLSRSDDLAFEAGVCTCRKTINQEGEPSGVGTTLICRFQPESHCVGLTLFSSVMNCTVSVFDRIISVVTAAVVFVWVNAGCSGQGKDACPQTHVSQIIC